jgi:alkylated DNA repair dioxygenase AlkB
MSQFDLFSGPGCEPSDVGSSLSQLVVFDPKFMSPDSAEKLFTSLRSSVDWRQNCVRMYGQQMPIPRLTAWFGDEGTGYSYSGIWNDPQEWPPELLQLRQQIESSTGESFNSVLLNLYREGSDSVSWHSDDEPEIDQKTCIASFSVGATRCFKYRDITFKGASGRRKSERLDLTSGSLLIMKPGMQLAAEHCIPKTKRIIGERINLTFRSVRVRQNSRGL